ncbi:FliI/YscN family ATPase [Yoonia litorea]|uniref:Flagellum-specific ATP synthase n=1 Tax=Yoonia litorea TaxID=1123755 RepID=A0A1I6MUI4_9RHOB|nr:flagellum-specific ATP synthase FliI [Yoonia litorea]SFS19198.1 flagellum-specific ATP synthase [Yoonia litorea]
MLSKEIEKLRAAIRHVPIRQTVSRVIAVEGQVVIGDMTCSHAKVGDRLHIAATPGPLTAEVIKLTAAGFHALLDAPPTGLRIGDRILLSEPPRFAPDNGWIGRVIDPDGNALDGRPILPGLIARQHDNPPPPAYFRRGFGVRFETGIAVFNTMLPIVSGQRIGLFAGAGVGKTTLIGDLVKGLDADVIVVGLVGERGRELQHFIKEVLGDDGMRKTVIVAATSDRSALVRKRCALAAMTVAEHFRDQGRQVALFIDSITRFCEAYREVAISQGEEAKLRGFPASLPPAVANLCERAGPGVAGAGDITAVFSVLTAGADMDEPVADLLRGILDGHTILSREIAEAGRYPAVDVVRSVSRALPTAATDQENVLIAEARSLLSQNDQAALMVRSGLYEAGSDPLLDRAVACFSALEHFLATADGRDRLAHFSRLRQALV